MSGIGGFLAVILFMFCAVRLIPTDNTFERLLIDLQPDTETLFSFSAPQPFVPLYALVLGRGGHIFMNVICIVALWFVSSNSKLF